MGDFSKKMKKASKDTYFFWAILIICALIIGESIWVVSKFVSRSPLPSPTERVKELFQTETKKAGEIEVWLEGEEEIVVNEFSEVRLGVRGLKDSQILGADFVLTYDPDLVKIIDQDTTKTGVQVKTFETGLGEVARNLVEEDKGRIVISLVNLDEEGAMIKQDEEIALAVISFVPLTEKEVKFTFKLAVGEETGTKIMKAEAIPSLANLMARDYRALVINTGNNFNQE